MSCIQDLVSLWMTALECSTWHASCIAKRVREQCDLPIAHIASRLLGGQTTAEQVKVFTVFLFFFFLSSGLFQNDKGNS